MQHYASVSGAEMGTVGIVSNQEGMTDKGWSWMAGWDKILAPSFLLHAQGWLYVMPFLPSEGMQEFARQVSEYTKSSFNLTISPDLVDLTYSAALYNAIMLYAYAATKVLSEGGDLHDGQAVTEAVRSTPFEGVGGNTVVLDKQGDRIESYDVMNFVVEADGGMGSVPVGLYNSSLGEYTAYERAVVWPGSTTVVPVDYLSGAPGMLPHSTLEITCAINTLGAVFTVLVMQLRSIGSFCIPGDTY